MVCHYWFLIMGSNFKTITVKGVDYRCIILDISQSEAIFLLQNSAFDDRGYIQNAYQRNQY